MSTLAEIEAAADNLPPEQQAELLAFLAERLRHTKTKIAAAHFRLSRRGFPISQGRAAFTSDDVARLEAEGDSGA